MKLILESLVEEDEDTRDLIRYTKSFSEFNRYSFTHHKIARYAKRESPQLGSSVADSLTKLAMHFSEVRHAWKC